MAFRQQKNLAHKLLAEGRHGEAERAAKLTVGVLASAGLAAPLSEALMIHGTALARLKRSEEAQKAFDRAIKVAEHAKVNEYGVLAAITAAEELIGDLPLVELRYYHWRAEQLLDDESSAEAFYRVQALASRLFALEKKIHSERRAGREARGPERPETPGAPEPTAAEVAQTINYLERLYGRRRRRGDADDGDGEPTAA